MNSAKKSMAKDTAMYIPTKIIEGIIGIITIALYTRVFNDSSEIVGQYNIISVTINLCACVLTGWIAQSTFRYINDYKNANRLTELLSTNIIMILGINIATFTVVVLIGSIFFGGYIDTVTLILACLMFSTYSIWQASTSLLAALRQVKLNMILSVCSASLKLVLFVFFATQVFHSLKGILLSIIIADIICITTVAIKMKFNQFLKISAFKKDVLKKIARYGFPVSVAGLTIGLLNMSDRYIIQFLSSEGTSDVAVYTSNYSIASAAFTMIMVGIMRGVYPNILQEYKNNDKIATEELLSWGVRLYTLVALPAAVGLLMLSGSIAKFLGENFWQGSGVIGIVAVAMFVYGLTEYSNKAFELSGNTKPILQNGFAAMIINIVLNLVLVKRFGYIAAAYVTLISYLFYFGAAHIRGRKLLTWRYKKSFALKICLALTAMAAFLAISNMLGQSLALIVPKICIAIVIYFGILIATGELSQEIEFIKNIKSR